jgi:hypothetical protein
MCLENRKEDEGSELNDSNPRVSTPLLVILSWQNSLMKYHVNMLNVGLLLISLNLA